MSECAATASNNRTSGIPRLSRLPVLNKRSSQHFGIAPAQNEGEQASATIPPTTTTATTTTAARLAKRSSIASLPQQKRELPSNRTQTGTLRPSVNGTAAPKLNTKNAPTRPYTTSRQAYASASTNGSPSDGGDGDRLSSLSNFGRTASRQTMHDDHDSPTDTIANSLPTTKPRGSRPSLSDRAIESIQTVPSTPRDRRQSSFFSQVDSPMAPPQRPSSVMSGLYDRPNTSSGASSKPLSDAAARVSMSARPLSRTSTAPVIGSQTATAKRTSAQSLSARLQSAREPPQQTLRPASPVKKLLSPKKAGFRSTQSQTKDSHELERPLSGTGSKRTPCNSTNSSSSLSSAALRQQIAAARAAVKKDREHVEPGAKTLPDDDDDEDDEGGGGGGGGVPDVGVTHADPFNQAPRDDKHILRNRIKTARIDGKLNISALGLKIIPEEVLSMYNSAAMQESNISWAEIVDLTKFIAADNDLDAIDDSVFPDLTQEELLQEEHEQAAQFGGVELLDLHGNTLSTIPRGIRRLERLTSLNLVHNKIDNAALEIISEVKTLRELRLGHNSISGSLPSALCSLKSLEVLDVQANRLLALPEAICELSALKMLNVSGNQLTTLPMDAIARLPLQELDSSSNALIASLFPLGGLNQHKTLRTLNVANNSLAALTFSPDLGLPDLQTLDVTNNHLTILPSMKGLPKLMTLTAGDNKISDLPDGFTSLRNLRIANLSGNELHVLPAELALMDSLTTLVLASNPLRHKKYLTMGATDIKQDLRVLLDQKDRSASTPDDYDDELASWGTAPEDVPAFGTGWAIKPNGLLDLSNKGLTDAINDALGSFLRTNDVRQLKLSNNKLTIIPPALWLAHDLRSLDLSNNPLQTDYLSDELTLPMLSELDLSNCRITVVEPLLQHLRAPEMQSLQLNGNRITGAVPQFRQTYPRLTTLLASDDKFTSVSVEALRGFMIVDLTSNDLQSLPAEIGLLWDEGLKSFEVGRNAFRVPGHRVLEKGTQATMRWLKDRIKIDNEQDQTIA